MPEPLITSHHLVGQWDPDLLGWEVRDFVAGPAGSAGLELAGGVSLDVDVAAPSTLTGLWFPGSRGRLEGPVRTVAEALLGRERALELVALQKRGGPPRILEGSPFDRLDPWGLGDRDEPSGAGPNWSRRRGIRRGVDAALMRLALALDLDEAPPGTLRWALSRLEAVAAARPLDRSLLEVDLPSIATEAAEVLVSHADDPSLDRVPARDLRRAIREVRNLLPDELARDLRRIARPEEPFDERSVPSLALRVGAPMARPAGRPQPSAVTPLVDVLDRTTLPPVFDGAVVATRQTTDSEIEVRIVDRADNADGWWARALSADDVLQAAAPFRRAGADAVARLLVPPAIATELVVDITDAPHEPRPAQALRAVAEAVRLGRAAAQADRLGRRREAASRWRDCAEAWERAGDLPRAGLAGEYARGAATPSRPPMARTQPLLADHLAG